MPSWNPSFIGPLRGKTALLTNGTETSGPLVARELLRNGARVVFSSRDEVKGKRIEKWLRREVDASAVSFRYLDLAEPESIEYFSKSFQTENYSLHLLLNNFETGILPKRGENSSGRELTFVSNYLGHFSLTAQLFGLLKETTESRVIFQSGIEYKKGEIDFYDLEGHFHYDPEKAFASAQLAKLIFALELHRRIQAAGLETRCIAVCQGALMRPGHWMKNLLRLPMTQSPQLEANTLLYAATSWEVQSGAFYGPRNFGGRRGQAHSLEYPLAVLNQVVAEKLWEESERLSGIKFVVEGLDNLLVFPVNKLMKDELQPRH